MRALIVVLLGLLAATASSEPIPLSGKSCAHLQAPVLAPVWLKDVEGGLTQDNFNTVQRAADLYAWQQLITLHWPADPQRRGEPDRAQPISAPGPRVWETWKEAYEVYLPDGRRPLPWNRQQAFPSACGSADKWLFRTSKVSDVVDATLQALPVDGTLPATLKDQQGRLLRYEIRLNQRLYDYVVRQRLYDGRRQQRADRIDFPDGSQLVKAAWREVSAEEAPYFLTTQACVCEDAEVDQPTHCSVRAMGLAGFHLMSKTPSAPQWIWSTYEQVDNTTPIHAAVPALNNPDCGAELCPPNQQTPAGVPTQLSRVNPIPARDPDCSRPEQALDNVVQLNADMRAALAEAGSLLVNYQLIGTQWPLPTSQGSNFKVLPAVLANTTMESFAQDTSSCMGCHAMSRTLRPDRFVSADFSFTLNNAQPRPRGARCVDVEASESCSDDQLRPPGASASADVRRGYRIATSTYETVGAPYVDNQLHCQSCHLNAGGNPAAAWWVDMRKAYPTPEQLQARINSCFDHSMNGQALCTPGSECEQNPTMRSLIAYMDWLTAQYRERHPFKRPARGYPDQQNPRFQAAGDATRGAEIYQQKCAYCHNADGQGRYQHGYFRPALWGAASYNAQAGMARNATLAAFLHSNMPYTSGGLLTVQEAVDLAAFINAQPRPAGEAAIAPSAPPD